MSNLTLSGGNQTRWFSKSAEIALISAIGLVALAIRAVTFRYQSSDYLLALRNWYNFIASHGGFASLKYDFADYNAPYLYVMAALTYLPVHSLTGIKLVSVLFDFILAFFVYRLVEIRRDKKLAILAALAIVFLPTVFLNSAAWAQADSIYAAFAMGSLYYAIKKKPWLSCVFFGISLAFKLQAIFVSPVFLILAMTGWMTWRALLAIPAAYLALDIPAILLGASPHKLLTVYFRQSGEYAQLTLNAPSVFQFFHINNGANVIRTAAVLFTLALVLVTVALVVFSRVPMTGPRIILLTTTSAILVPYFLPSMHERYFYLADTLSVVAAFYAPRKLWYLPILVQFASVMSYLPPLFPLSPGACTTAGVRSGFDPTAAACPGVDYRILATIMLVALIAALACTAREMGVGGKNTTGRTDMLD